MKAVWVSSLDAKARCDSSGPACLDTAVQRAVLSPAAAVPASLQLEALLPSRGSDQRSCFQAGFPHLASEEATKVASWRQHWTHCW